MMPGNTARGSRLRHSRISETISETISEIANGDPPHRPHGCPAQAWSVTELLRAWIATA